MVILHYDQVSDREAQQVHRVLTTTNNSTIPLSEFQISQYQICLWTGLMFVILLAVGVCAVAQMDAVPDNILYAKFQSGRTEKRD